MSIVIKEIEQENLLEKVREYLREQLENLHISDMIGLMNEINSYDADFDKLVVYENDEEFFETHFGNNLMEAIRAIHFGDYSYNDTYVKFDAYGNLESLSEYEVKSDFYNDIDDIIDWLLDNPDCINLDYYIDTELLDEFLENK